VDLSILGILTAAWRSSPASSKEVSLWTKQVIGSWPAEEYCKNILGELPTGEKKPVVDRRCVLGILGTFEARELELEARFIIAQIGKTLDQVVRKPLIRSYAHLKAKNK